MQTNARGNKLVIISDVHLGNPFSKCKDDVASFLKWAALNQYDICINGDGLEIAQVSFHKLAVEIPEMIKILREIQRMGRKVYYVVGNHDISLEYFLEDWGALKVCPFLNYHSNETRVRIEHGHLYDPFFINFPDLYETLTYFAGFLLGLNPNLYKLWMKIEKLYASLRAKKGPIAGELPEFSEAALEISERGFDAVVFGHTHHLGRVELPNGKLYFNSGSWLMSMDYIEIDNGVISLKKWSKQDSIWGK